MLSQFYQQNLILLSLIAVPPPFLDLHNVQTVQGTTQAKIFQRSLGLRGTPGCVMIVVLQYIRKEKRHNGSRI
jgi:hypothetical protein